MARQFPLDFPALEPALKVRRKGALRLLLAAMRPHQWVKNLFVFAPLLFGRKIGEMTAVAHSAQAFAAFCLLASGLYILNDIADADEDRRHPEKCLRPISSGLLPVPFALGGAILLIATGLTTAMLLDWKFFLVAAGYFALTLFYCLRLKKMLVLDCMTIAAGFVLRVVGGAVAIQVAATHWLIVCAFLLALFLAFTKRRQEILTLSANEAGKHREVLDEYSIDYLGQVNNILIGAAIVCYALYTVAPETVQKFETDALIYGTVFVIYGLFRYLMLAKKPENGGNPSRMLLRDKPLTATVAAWAMYNAVIIYHVPLKNWFDIFNR